ncbi:MAG: hypothetical protein K2Q12_08280 [Rickettsiales bacterium]|nr:hypothetical protein [Rickettsiales bacterium]
MPTLWHRFAEDSALPSRLDNRDKEILAAIFDPTDPNSIWSKALIMIGLPTEDVPDGLLCWHRDTPYINWNAMVDIVSGGSLFPEPKDEKFTYRYTYTLSTTWSMVKAHWHISRYVQNHLAADIPLPDDNEAKLVESLALGFCILALTMRIPSTMLHGGLADTYSISKTFRSVIIQIKSLQHRRNQLSPAWTVLFQAKENEEAAGNIPEFFWNHPPKEFPTPLAKDTILHTMKQRLSTQWHGIPITGEPITCRAFLVRNKADEERVKASNERLVLIFPLARPDTTVLFSYAAAVLYAQGGALSHAASIAREQNLPSITGLGKEFIAEIVQHLALEPNLILRVDPLLKRVECALSSGQYLSSR